MDEFVARGNKPSTRERRERGFRCPAFNLIRDKKIIETTADDLRAVIAVSGSYTNECLKCLHNLALGLGWLSWPIIPAQLWPKTQRKNRRAITADEHQQIIAAERNIKRRRYYELLWENRCCAKRCREAHC